MPAHLYRHDTAARSLAFRTKPSIPAPWSEPEAFAAELALRDLEPGRDGEGTERIVARFLAARLALGDPSAGIRPDAECAAARVHIDLLPAGAERDALRALVPGGARPVAARAFAAAGEAAAAQGHRCGAFLLFRAGFRRAREAHDPGEAARLCRAIAGLARAADAAVPARAWSARARRMERAAARRATLGNGRAVHEGPAGGDRTGRARG